jgi:hypothetical protein
VQNGTHNSQIEVNLGVIRNLLEDIADMIAEHPQRPAIELAVRDDLHRDYETIVKRSRHEGIQFLTITLPSLGKWYDKFLPLGGCHPGFVPLGFKPYWSSNQDTCPLLCRTYYYVLSCFQQDMPETAEIIRGFRTLFYLFYKLEVPLAAADEAAALTKWKTHESWLEDFFYPGYMDQDVVLIRDIITRLLDGCEWIFTRFRPQHGPGAVAGKEVSDAKWANAHRIKSLHRVYPRYDLYFGYRSSGRISTEMAAAILDFCRGSKTLETAQCRLLFVPKDSRSPRVISCEPKELMFVQQGVARNFMKVVERRTYNHINFLDQSINANLARISSRSGNVATVDLEDASDCVSLTLVELLFPEWAHRYLRALRSSETLLPDGTVVSHHKYAPMGSALCFPIESIVFWAVCVAAHITEGFTYEEARLNTFVYGDDLIIHSQSWGEFLRITSKLAIKVNKDKSFVLGPFRESCGLDAYHGNLVTPLRIKKDLYLRSRDGIRATSICKYASRMFDADLRRTGEYLASLVEQKFGLIPRVTFDLGCLHIKDPLALDDISSFKPRFDLRMCALKIRGWVVDQPLQNTNLDGLGRLLKNHYGDWTEHDPATVAVPRAAKTRKRDILVEMVG